MDRYWLLTWTTWGTWLPGDARGSRSPIRTRAGRRRFNIPGTPPAPPQPMIEHAVARRMTADPVHLTMAQAHFVLASLRATALAHDWPLFAIAVMRNHVHVVVGVPGDPDPADLLRDLKRSSSAALNRAQSGERRRWWTRSGSRRRLYAEPHVLAAIRYVRNQPRPLVTWEARLPGPD